MMRTQTSVKIGEEQGLFFCVVVLGENEYSMTVSEFELAKLREFIVDFVSDPHARAGALLDLRVLEKERARKVTRVFDYEEPASAGIGALMVIGIGIVLLFILLSF